MHVRVSGTEVVVLAELGAPPAERPAAAMVNFTDDYAPGMRYVTDADLKAEKARESRFKSGDLVLWTQVFRKQHAQAPQPSCWRACN